MKRNVKNTKQRILDAIGVLLSKSGCQDIGINAIAREAGVSKVLIYRYFGGLSELLHEFAQKSDFWPTTEEQLGRRLPETKDMSLAEIGTRYLTAHLKDFRKRPATQEIMRWELVQENTLTKELYSVRESRGMELIGYLFDRFQKEAPGMDVPAIMGLMHAGISYLVLSSKNANQYAGIDLHSDQGWERLERAIEEMVKIIMTHYQSHAESQDSEKDKE